MRARLHNNEEFDARAFVKTLTQRPGVYHMLDADGTVLYVGKARNLKKRVGSYARATQQSPKIQALMTQTRSIEVTVTHTETEALLLENHLIKELKPRYNLLLRDDKSYPYIYVSTHQEFPRLAFHRGARHGKGRYFGPYPSASAARETLNQLQKVFPVRQCEDSFFRNRARPCLQYQIERCTAPCTGLIDPPGYAEHVRHALMFLDGQSTEVIDELVRQMEEASEGLEFERAARIRDRIAKLRTIQEKQYVSREGGDIDIIATAVQGACSCVQVFMIRDGRNLGNKTFFPQHPAGVDAEEILEAFIPQHYLGRSVPGEILVSHTLPEKTVLEQALATEAGHRVRIRRAVRGERVRWMEMALNNAAVALEQRLSSRRSLQARFEALQDALGLDSQPQRLECFDISHIMGEATVASCVVFDTAGPVKSDYRRYNIEGVAPGDDFGALRQALMRRYTRLKEGEGKLPDILFIDGGKGQLSQAQKVLQELQIGGFAVIAVAKGRERKAGTETLFLLGRDKPTILPPDSPGLHLIQQIRDEAHRFAITGHRQRRARARRTSVLEEIPGMGPKRRQRLLKQFGGLQGVTRAGVDDLANVQGISRQLAQRIYEAFHHNDG